jgi:cell division protease FtsH
MPPTRPPPPPEPPRARFHFVYIVLALLGVYLVQGVISRSQGTTTIPYSQFQQLLHDGKIKEVLVRDDQLLGELEQPLADGNSRFVTQRVDEKLATELARYDVTYTQARESTLLPTILSWVLPVALFFGVWVFLMRRMAGKMGPGGNMLAIGKSKAKVYVEAETGVKFDDVAGVEEAKGELREVVDFLRDPARYGRLGGRMPKGVLLVGPPGTGKTLLARAVAGEAKVPFFSISGSEFVEMFVGVGAARVRDLFEQAKTKAPCIIFIDELDALGRARSAGSPFGGHDEKEQTLNQLLVEMDGFDSSAGIVLLAATNRPEVLDPALLRAGRFDRQVLVDRPDRIGRAAILRVHARKVKLDAAVELDQVAALTAGFTGADLANLVNEAALAATRRGAGSVELVDFTVAIERIVAGLEKKTRLLVPKERRAVAFHEMGHALVAGSHADTDPVHKVSIIPRGIGALGYTIQRPTEDRFLMTKGELEQKLDVLLGGRAAEDLVFGEVSTGASDDLARATDIARSMVTRYGMLPEIGQVVYDSDPPGFLAQNGPTAPRRAYSDDTAREIDRAVRQIIDDAFSRARAVLAEHRAVLEDAATALLSQETLTEAELAPYFARVRGSASTPSRTPPT